MEKISEKHDDEPSFVTCEICIEPLLNKATFNNKNQCKHPFCDECIAKYITVQVESGGDGIIKCPGLSCVNNLDPLSCRSLISPTVFTRWCDFLCESTVLGFKKQSYCPNSNCSELVVNECRGTVKKTTCPNCKQLFCFNCKSEWHPQFQCKEYIEENDILLSKLVETNKWKRCPKCRRPVERTSGCAKIICRCKTSFCYDCGKVLRLCCCAHVHGVQNEPHNRFRGCLTRCFYWAFYAVLFLLVLATLPFWFLVIFVALILFILWNYGCL